MLSLLFAALKSDLANPPAAASSRVTALDRVRKRLDVEVVKIAGTRDEVNLLAQLGIRVGERLRVKRTAPLGGAVLVEAGGRSVALGRVLAGKVKVQTRT